MAKRRIIDTLDELTAEVRKYLKSYLETMGVQFVRRNWFRCINPDHEDADPSCQVVPKWDNEGFHCLGCGFSGNIFTAAHLYENIPLSGPEWIEESLYYLANKFGITYDDSAMITDEMRERYAFMQVTNAVHAILKTDAADVRAAEARGWNKKTCQMLGIGAINEKSLTTRMKRDIGISQADLGRPPHGKYGIIKANLFGNDRLTFTMFDYRGNAIGFQSRDLNWVPPSIAEDGTRVVYPYAKYINSAQSPIYNKRYVLTGIHMALREKTNELWLFEGIGSMVTAYQEGLRNSTSTCGTAITEEQISLAFEKGFRKLYICTDDDEAGNKSLFSAIERIPMLMTVVQTFVVKVPAGDKPGENDPDYYIRAFGIKDFKKLPRVPLFQWAVDNISHDKEGFVYDMVELIAKDPNPISWGPKIRILSQATGISENLITMQVTKTAEGVQKEIEEQELVILETMRAELRRAEAPVPILEDALEALDKVGSRRIMDDDVSSCLTWTDNIIKEFEVQEEGTDKWITDWERFNSTLEGGIPWEDYFMIIGGLPQQGKTAFMINLAMHILSIPKNENLCLYYMTIDDSWRQVLPKMAACWLNGELKIKECRYPKMLNAAKRDMWEDAMAEIRMWIETGRLKVTDHTQSDSLSYAIQQIRTIQQRFPDRKVLFFLDNFHKLKAPGDSEREKFKYASEKLHAMTTKYRMSIICTAELNKKAYGDSYGRRPQEKDLSETGKLAYDSNLVSLVHTDLEAMKYSPERIRYYWTTQTASGKDKQMPVVELDIVKQKGGVCRTLYFKLWPTRGFLQPVHRNDIDHRNR